MATTTKFRPLPTRTLFLQVLPRLLRFNCIRHTLPGRKLLFLAMLSPNLFNRVPNALLFAPSLQLPFLCYFLQKLASSTQVPRPLICAQSLSLLTIPQKSAPSSRPTVAPMHLKKLTFTLSLPLGRTALRNSPPSLTDTKRCPHLDASARYIPCSEMAPKARLLFLPFCLARLKCTYFWLVAWIRCTYISYISLCTRS